MKIQTFSCLTMLLLVGCASAFASEPAQSTAEAAIVSASVIRAHRQAHPGCPAASATRTRVVEGGKHSSMEEWSASCGDGASTYKVLVARLGGGITADVVGASATPNQEECVELKRMLAQAQRSNEEPTPDLISAHEQVMYKTLACAR